MTRSEPTASRADLLLRDVTPADWTRTLADETVIKRTIVSAGQLAGNIASWEHDGRREVGYWIGRDFWGRGIATRALSEFLDAERKRPLSAFVAEHNGASIRVLQKCGFRRIGEDDSGGGVGILLELSS